MEMIYESFKSSHRKFLFILFLFFNIIVLSHVLLAPGGLEMLIHVPKEAIKEKQCLSFNI